MSATGLSNELPRFLVALASVLATPLKCSSLLKGEEAISQTNLPGDATATPTSLANCPTLLHTLTCSPEVV